MSGVEHRQLAIAGDTVTVNIKRSARRRKRLSLSLQADGNALLQVPLKTPVREIDAMLARHQQWLLERRQQLQRHQRQNPPPQMVSGQRLPYLGGHIELALRQRPGRTDVQLQGQTLTLGLADTSSEQVAKKLTAWYHKEAQQRLPPRLAYWSQQLSWVGATPPLRLRRMRSRWGSCSADGRICLNSELIKLDMDLIDYVVVHELCHLQHFDHSPRFYGLMTIVLPDWQDRRRRLHQLRLIDLSLFTQ